MPGTTKIAVLTGAAIAVTATPVAADTTSTTTPTARVSGSAQIRLTYWPDQDVRTSRVRLGRGR